MTVIWHSSKTFKMVYLALLISFAVVIHTVEAAMPLPMPVPGAKIGLANIITLLTLILYGFKSGLIVAALRSVIGSLLIGTFLGFGFYLSFGGAVLSCIAMNWIMRYYRRGTVTLVSVSIGGAVAFNITQLGLASLLVQSIILFRGYLPFLLLLSLPTGFFTGLAAGYLEKSAIRAGLQVTTFNSYR